MKGTVRFRRPSVAHSTLLTIIMMCLNEKSEIAVEETTVEIFFHTHSCCTVRIALAIRYGASIIPLCTELQKQIMDEIAAMTPFTVEHVHLIVKRLITNA
ncbi:hypothetical protein [Thermaerobacillus caldiproteolyticus]|uniref:Putative alkaline shock family protein YloU n=1 Tax=Thermaerobacillus caldiproteolyticus TaxID=247480 RepID=A0A7V9Z4Z0_9BACL|nr:hypothetical protein [Anoxybacillus caldiproteolyticus]MBA2874117.1 putative alkaline shock family protein YloU [Anoxybacillus caldiproteolyticus]QPA31931.1 hypothetical protein ISX45_02720 [Anoxybacillus caldiproteolyticus]